MSGYAAPEEMAGFERSWSRFAALIAGLSDPASGPETLADLEEYLLEESREVMRQVEQDRLDQRAAVECRRERLTDAGGIVHTRVERGHSRKLVTVFGEVTVSRMAYRAPGATNLYPADGRLNLPVGRHSWTLARLAALESVRGSFDAAVAAVVGSTGQRVGKRQMLALAQLAGRDIAAFYGARRPGPAAAAMLLVLSFDGKGW